ncbi:hypothetical protein V5O48_013143 [Marasmius crinis-equi]|uniref:DUF985 domain-containing protein n=1 Tax=Marasmius crinis-equi TaxID=585013 RepID=A0ABR3F0W5_9AGAR
MAQVSPEELIRTLGLLPSPEGGYLIESNRQSINITTPFSAGVPEISASRSLSTSIYYLLTKDSPSGTLHKNNFVAYHILHQGRAEFILITTSPQGPKIEKKILGFDTNSGERRMIVVEPGVWKLIRLLPDSLEAGCLLTEVVVPGFAPEDHDCITADGLRALFEGAKDAEERIVELERYVKSL